MQPPVDTDLVVCVLLVLCLSVAGRRRAPVAGSGSEGAERKSRRTGGRAAWVGAAVAAPGGVGSKIGVERTAHRAAGECNIEVQYRN
jgi:hypothetical protein